MTGFPITVARIAINGAMIYMSLKGIRHGSSLTLTHTEGVDYPELAPRVEYEVVSPVGFESSYQLVVTYIEVGTSHERYVSSMLVPLPRGIITPEIYAKLFAQSARDVVDDSQMLSLERALLGAGVT
jgi:hypothetical protein